LVLTIDPTKQYPLAVIGKVLAKTTTKPRSSPTILITSTAAKMSGRRSPTATSVSSSPCRRWSSAAPSCHGCATSAPNPTRTSCSSSTRHRGRSAAESRTARDSVDGWGGGGRGDTLYLEMGTEVADGFSGHADR